MNSTAKIVFIRQIVVRIIYLTPFVLAFLYIQEPLNIISACLLVVKIKLPSETDMYELQVLGKHAALILTRAGNDTDREKMKAMQQTFGFGDEGLHQDDIAGASAKFLVDTIFGVIEAVVLVVMIISFTLQLI